MTLIDMALAFVVNHPAVTATIVGRRTMEQLESQLGAADVKLDDTLLDRIDEIVVPGRTSTPPTPAGQTRAGPGRATAVSARSCGRASLWRVDPGYRGQDASHPRFGPLERMNGALTPDIGVNAPWRWNDARPEPSYRMICEMTSSSDGGGGGACGSSIRASFATTRVFAARSPTRWRLAPVARIVTKPTR